MVAKEKLSRAFPQAPSTASPMPMSMVSCARSCLCRRYLQHPSLLRREHWRASERVHRTFVHVNTFPDLVRKRT